MNQYTDFLKNLFQMHIPAITFEIVTGTEQDLKKKKV